MTTATPDYWINDADQHYYEPDDCYSRHIEAQFKNKTMRIDRSTPGVPGRMYIGEDRCHFFSVGAGDSIGSPGMMKAFLQGASEEGGSPSLNPIDGLAPGNTTTLSGSISSRPLSAAIFRASAARSSGVPWGSQ